MKYEAYFTKLLWQNNGQQNGLISPMLFFELHKIMVNKVIFVCFRRGRSSQSTPLDQPLDASKTKLWTEQEKTDHLDFLFFTVSAIPTCWMRYCEISSFSPTLFYQLEFRATTVFLNKTIYKFCSSVRRWQSIVWSKSFSHFVKKHLCRIEVTYSFKKTSTFYCLG